MATFPTSLNPLSAVLEKRNLTAAEGVMMGLAITKVDDAEPDLGYIPKGFIKHLERLPYFDLTGNPIKDPKLNGIPFVRYRIERPEGWKPTPKGTLGKNGKPIRDAKYLSPLGSSVFVYLPRLDGFPWGDIAANASVPVILTEGEYKSYAVCKTGDHPCVGLTGTQSFGKNGEPYPYPLSEFTHLGRDYFICFDADSESDSDNTLKREVAQAAMRLASKLAISGARPFLLHIARTGVFKKARETDPDCKMGVDDYLAAGGTIAELMATATEAVECHDMAVLRSTYAYYVGEGPHIVNVTNGDVYKTGAFIHELEVKRVRLQERKQGAPLKVYVAREFIEARDRPEIDRKVFWPHYPSGYDAEARIYNEWRGFGVEGHVGEGEGEEYNEIVAIWKRFVKGLFGEHDSYFEKWLAHLFQRPGEKTTLAVILASPLNGVGKSLLGEIIRGMVGGASSVAIELDRAMKAFNAQLARKIFLQMDEAEGKFSGHESKLKDLVSADTVTIEKKNFDPVSVDNFARVYLTSNSVSPIRMDAENRRFFVAVPEMTKRESLTVWGPWVSDVVAKRLKSADGLRMLRWYLDRVDLTGWDPCARVIVTSAMLDMVDAGRTKSNEVVDGLWEAFTEDEAGLWALVPELRKKDAAVWANFIARLKAEGGQTLSHVYKNKAGKVVRVTLLDRSGKLPRHKTVMEDRWTLLNVEAKLSAEDCLAADRRTAVAYEAWKGLVLPDAKYS